MTLALLAFLAVFLLITSIGLLIFYREAMLQRLSSVISPDVGSPKNKLLRLLEVSSKNFTERDRSVSKSAAQEPRRGFRHSKAADPGWIPEGLASEPFLCVQSAGSHFAGFPGHGDGGLRLRTVLCLCPGAGLGFLAPDFWLGNRITARQLNIRLGLPQALDLMVICIEAGLSIDQATVRVADELQISEPVLSDELSLVNLEQRAGRPRADAWRNLAERTDVDSVRAMVSVLIQADQFGTSVAKTLRVYSDTLRTQAPPAGRGTSREDYREARVPAGAFHFSVVVRGGSRPIAIVMADAFAKYFSIERKLERRRKMDNVTLIRVVAGVCFVIVLMILIQRRRKRVH